MENEKRKSKLNIIDVIIILAILAVAVFVGMKFFGGSASPAKSGYVNYTVLVEGVPKATFDNIKASITGKTISNGQYIDCEILSYSEEPCEVVTVEKLGVNNAHSIVTYAPSGEYLNLVFTMRAAIDLNSILTEVGTQEVRAGRSHIVKTKDFEFTGLVLTVSREG